MCSCGLSEGIHWYSDTGVGADIWQIGHTPEEAEHALRSWAAKVVRQGHLYIDIRSTAGRILRAPVLNMTQLCTSPTLLALARDSVKIGS